MKKIAFILFANIFLAASLFGQNCPSYASTATSAPDACGGQIYYLDVANTACPGLIWFDVTGNSGSWGNEITWIITSNLSGATVASGGPYADNVPISVAVGPLDPAVHGNYFTLTVYDSYGDGFNGIGYIQVQQGASVYAYQDATWSTDEWAMIFGANINIYSSTITVTTPSGPVSSTAANCLDHSVALTLDNTNFCTPININLPWSIVCDGTGATIASGTQAVTVYPQVPSTSSDLVTVNWDPATCQWDVQPQNDCDLLDIGTIFDLSPDPSTLPVDACSGGSQDFTVSYNGIAAGPNCCSTGGPLLPIAYYDTSDVSDATVQSSPFGGTNNSAYIMIPSYGSGGNATSLTLNVSMSGFCFNPPGAAGMDYWVTVYVDGNIIHDQMYTVPPTSFSETFSLADIPGGYNENSVIEIYIYPNSFSSGPTNTNYVIGALCAALADGQWTASAIDATLAVNFEQMAPSPTVCSFTSASPIVCCTPTTTADDGTTICSGAGTGTLSTWQTNVTASTTACVVYSSVTPVAGSTPPDGNLPNGINGGATPINQVVSAYSYCDADSSGTANAGDTYTLLSTYTLTVDPIDNPSFSMTATCDGGTANVTGTAGGTFSFNTPPGDGATIDPSTGTITGGTPGTTYDILYTTSGACPANTTQNVTALAVDDPGFTLTPLCDGATASVTGTSGGSFSFSTAPTDGAVIDPTTGTISGGTPGNSYDVQYLTAGPCPDSSIQSVTALTADDPTFTMSPTCDGGTATISGTVGGTFSFDTAPTDGATIDPATGEITGGTPGMTYDVLYATSGACASSLVVSVTAATLDDPSFSMTPTCDGGVVSSVTTAGGTFSFNTAPADAATIDAGTGVITNGTPGTSYDVMYVTNGPCPDSTTVMVTASPLPPAPTVEEPATYCSTDFFAFMVATGTGGTLNWYTDASFNNPVGTGLSMVPINTLGTTTYYVTETVNGCTGPAGMVDITIEECGITIPTAFTPNGDLKNDVWELRNIDNVYPNNQVFVFNRWGGLIYESTQGDYENRPWDGTNNGQKLPVGSYYFMIEYHDNGDNVENGTVSIILK